MGIFKRASEQIERIAREEIDEPRRRAKDNDELARKRAQKQEGKK